MMKIEMPALAIFNNCSGLDEQADDVRPDWSCVLPSHVTSFILLLSIALGVYQSRFTSTNRVQDEPTTKYTKIPGPWSLPFVGSIHVLGRLWFESITGLRRVYGDVCRLTIGCRDVVVLSGWRTVSAALAGADSRTFAGRPRLPSFALASNGRSMTFSGISAEWRAHRRLAERSLKRADEATAFVETTAAAEARALADELCSKSESRGGRVDPAEDITQSVAHAMYTLCFGKSRVGEMSDECGKENICAKAAASQFDRMVAYTLQLVDCHNSGNAVNFFPWARRLLVGKLRALDRLCSSMLAVTMGIHAEHLASYVPGTIRDVVDALIESGQTGSGRKLDRDQVAMTVQEFIGAGLDILQAAFHWIVLYMAEHESVQERVRAEIDAVVGRRRAPTPQDVAQMPYTESVLLEVLRHSCVVPLALPHSTTADVQLNNVHVPADTFVLVNLHSVNRDPEHWSPDADRFNPDRFMADATRRALRSPTFTAFGLGRRRCIGEQLSRNVLFVYLVTLLQRCRVRLPADCDGHADMRPRVGIVLRPRPFDVAFERLGGVDGVA